MWAIAWNNNSYDGDRALSIWTKKEDAEKELIHLRRKTGSPMRIVEFKENKPYGLEDAIWNK